MTLYIVAGEASGDSRAAELMRALRERRSDIQFIGAGGPQMQAEAAATSAPEGSFLQWTDRAVVGLEPLKKYFYYRRQLSRMLNEIAVANPAALITVDFSGFNLRLAKKAKAAAPGMKTVHYVSPQIWASRPGRIPKMAKFLDLILCLFAFEVPLYEPVGLRAVWVGHPLLDSLPAKKIDVPRDPNLVALLPGSRSSEVRRIFPIMLDAAVHLRMSRSRLRFEAAAASESLVAEMDAILAARGKDTSFCPIALHGSHALMQRAGAGMVCSGTATLEAAYFGLPMAIIYKVGWFTSFIAKRLLISRWLGMPNVLARREIIREFLQEKALPNHIASELLQLLEHPATRDSQIAAVREVITGLGSPGAAQRAADAIVATLRA